MACARHRFMGGRKNARSWNVARTGEEYTNVGAEVLIIVVFRDTKSEFHAVAAEKKQRSVYTTKRLYTTNIWIWYDPHGSLICFRCQQLFHSQFQSVRVWDSVRIDHSDASDRPIFLQPVTSHVISSSQSGRSHAVSCNVSSAYLENNTSGF